MTDQIVTEIPESFLREFEKEILGQIPAEKVKADLDSIAIKRVLVNEGGVAINGLGQKLGDIPARVYFRWMQQEGRDCWSDRNFCHEFFADNPALKSDGWTPVAASSTRHGKTFVGGKPA